MRNTETIILHGESYRLGEPVISKGLDMNCFPCLCTGLIIQRDENGYYCNDNGVKFREDDLSHYFVDTQKNRLRIRKECTEYKKEWKRNLDAILNNNKTS